MPDLPKDPKQPRWWEKLLAILADTALILLNRRDREERKRKKVRRSP